MKNRVVRTVSLLTVLAGAGTAAATPPLHPVGDFDSLPTWPKEIPAEMVELEIRPPPDAALRQQRFEQRNDPESIRALCLKLNEAIEPDAPGLGAFRHLVQQADYAEALDAYRAYFFAKLRNPEKYGAHWQNLTGYQLKAGKKWVLKRVDPKFVEWAMQGVYTVDSLQGKVGPPGQMAWVPYALRLPAGATYGRTGNDHPFWQSEKGLAVRKEIEFFRALNKFPLDFMPLPTRLLESYVLTGNRGHLRRCCEILDDCTLNARRDIDAFAIDIRSATELESERLRDFPGMMRVMVDERPELAEQFDSATLARLTLHLLSDFIPYTIRAKRTELANWGIMGIGNAFHFATLFQEFKSMTYARRELWRLWNINFTQFFALDGAAWEACDTGHSRIAVPRARECMPYCLLPEVAGPLEREAFDDLLRDRMRYVVVQMTPRARQHPRFDPDYLSHPTYEWLEPKWTTFDTVSPMKELLWDRECEVRNRLQTVMKNMGRIEAADPPAVRSDLAPYAAMYFLRDSWDKDAEHFQLSDYQGSSANLPMRYVPHKSVIFGRETGRFDLSKNGCNLVVGNGITVDRKPGNFYHGWAKTGGKTIYCAQPDRTVVGHRFHSSDRFDLAESVQDHPYYRPPQGVRKDSHIFNLYNVIPGLDNQPVDDVKAIRQVFALRGEGLYLVNTRIENPSGAKREYAQFFALPAWVPATRIEEAKSKIKELREAGHRLIIEDPERGFLATSNIGRDNVSIHLAANGSLQFGNMLDGKGDHVSTNPQLDLMEEALAKFVSRKVSDPDFAKGWLSELLRPVSVRWTGEGSQVFQMVLAMRNAADNEMQAPLSGGLRAYQTTHGPEGVLGSAVITQNGTPVWFQAGPRTLNLLHAGPVQAKAEALMAMRKDEIICGMVLGAEAIIIQGKSYLLSAPDAEFAFAMNGSFTSTPVRRPIDTVHIAPDRNVFVDDVEVSFDIPSQDTHDIEFRYTLDGSDPTLDSPRYTKPFTIDRTSMVKVRPFRKGLAATPWNFPGTDAGKTMATILTKVGYKPARNVTGLEPGLQYEYLESDWPDLFMNGGSSGVIPVTQWGHAAGLLVPEEIARIRQGDLAYAIRYTGYLDIPEDGVYVLHAPEHLFDVTMDAGFDLRVWVDGDEWFPSPGIHAQNTWSVALKKGLHDFQVAFVDFRYKTFKSEYWLPWQQEEVWQGIPTLRVSGPGMAKQPLPRSWLKRRIQTRTQTNSNVLSKDPF
ncbi:MAG TPA: chitobiase/beta-hexosaminidase C-terminal domain-containing protein [Thermoguttaceae bacterium]|nr:chitobiase/beta-hexosaminidase C-terminal domain-containing protein [Thermoguttaceae bacterium]